MQAQGGTPSLQEGKSLIPGVIEAKGCREHFHVQRPTPRSKQGGHEWYLQPTPTSAPVLLTPNTSSYLLSFL